LCYIVDNKYLHFTGLPSTNPQHKPLPIVKDIQLKSSTTSPTTTHADFPKNRSSGSKTAALGRNIATVEKDDDTDGKHSKNCNATFKKVIYGLK
jgi:hypothetical protein